MQAILGASCEEGIPFYRAPDRQFGMGSIGPQFDTPPILIRQVALSDVLCELGLSSPNVIKIDVEGAELGVLQGATLALDAAQPPAVIFEFSDWAEARIPGQFPGAAQALLLDKGYQLHQLGRRGKPGVALAKPLTTGAAMILAVPTSADGSRRPHE